MKKSDKIIKIRLTKEQEKHFKTIEWLLDFNENIATGRSYLMAITFIKMAFKYPNRWIQVFDHFPSKMGSERLLDTIKSIISQNKELLKMAEFRQGEFKLTST